MDVQTIDPATGDVDRIDLEGIVNTGNGGCPFGDRVLLCEQGELDRPSCFVLVDPTDPSDTHVLLNNYHGRQFNSLNDAIVLPPPRGFNPASHAQLTPRAGYPPLGSTLWFTDPTYGHEQGFRPTPQLPSQVYVLDPHTGDVRVVADTFDHPNGICFSPDGETCYITDTSHIHGSGKLDPHCQSTT